LSAVYISSAALAARHGFFTRLGGVSSGDYASLNASLSGGDDPDAVRENRRRVAVVLDAARLVGLTQVHGTEVVVVEEPWADGQGPRADAMVTRQPGLALAVITADCAPVLLHDQETQVIGAAHAGWRGAVSGVLDATIDAMRGLGADPARITAAIGPCICQASYEVGLDLHNAVLARDSEDARFLAAGRPGHWQFDLAGYCAARLRANGLRTVDVLGLDTRDDPTRFFSHRRRTLAGGGAIGHQVSAVVL
jgi:YfiH family protein